MKKLFQKGLTLLVCAAAALVLCAPAQAIDFKISGQLNRAFLGADNGDNSQLFFVDNDNSSTRFRFTGNQEYDDYGLDLGFVWEVEMQSNPSNDVDIDDSSDIGGVTFAERKIEVYMGHRFGKLWLGQGSMASDGTSEVDLSGTDVITYSSIGDMAGGMTFRDSTGLPIAAVGGVFTNFDGLSRKDRVRYDTPKLWGFYLSGSMANHSKYDGALRYSGDFGAFGKLAAAAAYASNGKGQGGDSDWTQFNTSASWLHPIGLNLTVAYGTRDIDTSGRDDPSTIYAKVGWKFGIHAISVDYTETDDLRQDDDEGTSYSLGYVMNPWDSVQFYAAIRNHALKIKNTSNPDDIGAIMIGTRIKF